MKSTQQSFILPSGSDKAMLKKYLKTTLKDQEKRFVDENNLLLKRSKAISNSITLKDSDRKAYEKQIRNFKSQMKSDSRPEFLPLKGHNPAVYAPFDFSSSWSNIPYGTGYVGFYFHGPDKNAGVIGADLWNLTGTQDWLLSTVSSVGFLYFAPATATLSITAQAHFHGIGESINGESFAALELSATHFIPTSERKPIYTSIDIFRANARGWYNTSDTFVRTYSDFHPWEGRTLTLMRPVRKYQWYLITVTAKQHLIGWGMSGFEFFVGPISHTLV
jgi:hypothetical protein